ncbi:MAG TPA: trehalose-phosphatase [Herpetosiphonaceae bacterium]|nr:trehalose-phosphatase [Herpetosiphonaceae bacterium]
MIGPGPQVRQAAAPLLAAGRLGVFTDIDGTISPIAPTPDAARVDPDCRAALERLIGLATRVVAVSGRAAANAQAMLGLDQMRYVGNHGLEWWADGQTLPAPAALPYVAAVAAALAELGAHDLPDGVLIENKGVTASVHYRLAAEPDRAAALLGTLLADICDRTGLRLHPGRMIFELRPPLSLNKGSALADALRQDELDGAIFLGDDTTDVDGFLAMNYARAAGLRTLGVGVLSAETPPVVRETCDVLVPGVAGVAALLSWLADERARIQKSGVRSQESGR